VEGTTGIKAEEVIGTDKHWQAFYMHKRPCVADIILDGNIMRNIHNLSDMAKRESNKAPPSKRNDQ